MKQEDVLTIRDYTSEAKGIAFDTCHKIYILMDDKQMDLMREYGYDPLITCEQMSGDEMAAQVVQWFEDSCGLRFVNAVSTVEGDPNKGFEEVIPQGYQEYDTCEQCGAEDDDCTDGLCYDCYNE